MYISSLPLQRRLVATILTLQLVLISLLQPLTTLSSHSQPMLGKELHADPSQSASMETLSLPHAHVGRDALSQALALACSEQRPGGNCKHHREVIACVTDVKGLHSGALQTWVAALQRSGVHNFVIAALDAETLAAVEAATHHLRAEESWPAFQVDIEIDGNEKPSTSRERRRGEVVSALKYPVMKRILQLG